jgi:cation transport protein ChaC
MGDFWVFGYGSLMWKPGFEPLERRHALLRGAHRSLCVHSHVHRGTPQRPGLVLGLDRGGACRGIALRAPAAQADRILADLRARELVTAGYLERWRRIELRGGGSAEALVYLVDRAHGQYAGKLDPEEIVSIVRGAQGQSGRNPEYVLNTVQHLREEGIRDHVLEGIAARLHAQA